MNGLLPIEPRSLKPFVFVAIMLAFEWRARTREHGLDVREAPPILRWPIYWGLAWLVAIYFHREQDFFYFQF